LNRKVSSHCCHYTASLVKLCCTAKSHPTAVTILSVQCSSVVKLRLIPQHSLYCQFISALLYNQVSSLSSHFTAISLQLGCIAKTHPTAVNIHQVQCSSVLHPSLIPQQSLYCQFSAALFSSQVSSNSSHYTARSVQLSGTAKFHSTAVTIP